MQFQHGDLLIRENSSYVIKVRNTFRRGGIDWIVDDNNGTSLSTQRLVFAEEGLKKYRDELKEELGVVEDSEILGKLKSRLDSVEVALERVVSGSYNNKKVEKWSWEKYVSS